MKTKPKAKQVQLVVDLQSKPRRVNFLFMKKGLNEEERARVKRVFTEWAKISGSEKELADRLEISPQALSSWKTRGIPKTRYFDLAKILNRSVLYIKDGIDEQEQAEEGFNAALKIVLEQFPQESRERMKALIGSCRNLTTSQLDEQVRSAENSESQNQEVMQQLARRRA